MTKHSALFVEAAGHLLNHRHQEPTTTTVSAVEPKSLLLLNTHRSDVSSPDFPCGPSFHCHFASIFPQTERILRLSQGYLPDIKFLW